MTLQQAIAAELPFLRAEAEARMTSRVTIYRRTADQDQDETSGLETPEWEIVAADVPFRLGGTREQGQSREVGPAGAEVRIGVRTGHLPYGQPVKDDDHLDVTSGENAGTTWTVIDGEWQDQATARRVPIVSTDRPEEWN